MISILIDTLCLFQVVLACVMACAFAALLPLGYSGLGYRGLGYSGLGYSGLGYAHPGLVAPATYSAAAPVAYSGLAPATYAASFPTYETVSHSVDITHEPVEQHGYIVKY